jgi:hypothetical protein
MRARDDRFPSLEEWWWYVDDSLLKCPINQTQQILEHIKSIEPGVIEFTMEEAENDTLAVLDLKISIDRKMKKLGFGVNYKKTHTNINIKQKSNHPPNVKHAIIKGFADRARALCDPENLETELNNIEEVFIANGYKLDEITKCTTKESPRGATTEKTTPDRGMVNLPYVKGVTETLRRTLHKHGARVVSGAKNKVADAKAMAKQPLGDKQKQVVYDIPCTCGNHTYVGETKRQWKSRKNEHQDRVRLTHQDIREGKLESAEKRMNDGCGGLARHSTECVSEIDWERAKIITTECNWTQRKVREGIETLRKVHQGQKTLNTSTYLDPWKSTLENFF